MPQDVAYTFTGDDCICCPRPAGLSGAVTTATTSIFASTKACKLATANSGVPKNIIRILDFDCLWNPSDFLLPLFSTKQPLRAVRKTKILVANPKQNYK
jgi:hypothetical protein